MKIRDITGEKLGPANLNRRIPGLAELSVPTFAGGGGKGFEGDDMDVL